jgi:hypothetical protein
MSKFTVTFYTLVTSTRDHRHTRPALKRHILHHRFPEQGRGVSRRFSGNKGRERVVPTPLPM